MKTLASGLILLLSFSIYAGPLVEIPFFKDDKLINLEISGDFRAIKKGKHDSPFKRSWNDISIVYHQPELEGKDSNIIAQAQVRGSNRLSQCDFPPLKIDFKKEVDLSKTIFKNSKKMKLVTQCNRKERSRWVYREYLIYKLYELFSNFSFKTRPVNITFRDRYATDLSNLNGNIIDTQFNFFIENPSYLGKRNGNLEKLEVDNFDRNLVDKFELTKIYLFHYLVGEHDISIDHKDVRNVQLYQDKITKNVFPAPYDFDFSMMVRTLDIEYMSYIRQICGLDHQLYKVRPLFIQNKAKIFAIISETPYLDQNEKERLKNSFLEFFRRIENDQIFNQIVSNSERCKKG